MFVIYASALNFDLMHDCLLQKNKSIFCGLLWGHLRFGSCRSNMEH